MRQLVELLAIFVVLACLLPLSVMGGAALAVVWWWRLAAVLLEDWVQWASNLNR